MRSSPRPFPSPPDHLSASRRVVWDAIDATMRERWEHTHLPDLGPKEVERAMLAPTTPMIGARETLARMMGVAGGAPQPTAQRNPPKASRNYDQTRAKSGDGPQRQTTRDEWFDEYMVIYGDRSNDTYHNSSASDAWSMHNPKDGPFGGSGGQYLGWGSGETDENEEPEEEAEPSIALNGSDLDQLQQQACFVQRMGIWEEDVDWYVWWSTIVDAAIPPIPFPGPIHLEWHRPGDNAPEGYQIHFTRCGSTVVFVRRLTTLHRSAFQNARRAVWEVWAYRSPDCTSEGLSSSWMDRNC